MKKYISILVLAGMLIAPASSQSISAQGITLDDVLQYRYYPRRASTEMLERNPSDIQSSKLRASNVRAIYRRSSVADYTYDGKWTIKDGECPKFSPDGKLLGYVHDNNLYVLNLENGNTKQITADGKFNFVINGKPDWVYEEEFEFNCAFDFSSDSKKIAWIRFDESEVKTFSFPWYKGLAPEIEEYTLYTGNYEYKYPKAGEDNSKVSVLCYDLSDGTTTTMNVPLDEDGYIPRIQFTDHADRLAVMTLNRLQNHFCIYMVNPTTGQAKLCHDAKANVYFDTNLYSDIDFSNDQYLLQEDIDGYNHLYLYNIDGKLIKQLTKGNYDVTEYIGRVGDTFYYASNEGSPLEQYIYKVSIKGKKTLLTPEKGYHSATFDDNFNQFVDNYSTISTPPVYTLRSSDGKVIRTLEDNATIIQEYAKFGTAELFSFTTSEGVQLNGWMVKPKNFDANKKYPVLMYQYSGPGNQQVHNSWSNGHFSGLTWEHRLAEKGYIVACVDGRGTGGRGADFKKCTYGRLCDLESKDQVETAIYLGSLPYVDKNRIGIWGWSFGGENTLMSMSEGRPVFNCGVAVAPVTSNRFYDTVYTERYMGLPQTNAAGYDDNAITRVSKLHGALLLCHGYADDNVHFQNMAEYTEALVQAGIQFESQFYVNRNHGIRGGNTTKHLFTRIENFLDEHLKPVPDKH